MRSNENKMSDGGRDRTSLGVEGWRSSQKWSAQRSVVRSIAWLGRVFILSFYRSLFHATAVKTAGNNPKLAMTVAQIGEAAGILGNKVKSPTIRFS